MKKCVVCNEEFQQPSGRGGHNRVVCFNPNCKKENDSKKKRESFLRLFPKRYEDLKEYSRLHSIPVYRVLDYGIDFLNENPLVVEAIQLETKLSGKFTFLTDEEKSIRRKVVRNEANFKSRSSKPTYFKSKNCKICNKEFTPGVDVSNSSLTCSKDCSHELGKVNARKSSRKQRERNKLKNK